MTSRQILGPAVRAIREAMGIRHGELAQRASLNPGYLTLIEQGKRQPSAHVISKLAKALGQPLDAISYAPSEEDAA